MTAALTLSITTPLSMVLQSVEVVSLRAEDASGGFGILPGHADFVTVIDAGVMRWRGESGPWRYCAVRGGIFSVRGGTEVRVACREAIRGDDLPTLESQVAAVRQARIDAGQQARSHAVRLHARAIRRLMQELAGGGSTLEFDGEDER